MPSEHKTDITVITRKGVQIAFKCSLSVQEAQAALKDAHENQRFLRMENADGVISYLNTNDISLFNVSEYKKPSGIMIPNGKVN
jgi:hypothetical protein